MNKFIHKKYDLIPHSALYIDMNFQKLKNIMPYFFKPLDRQNSMTFIKTSFSSDESESVFLTLSERTAFDLLLQGLNYPKGTDILMSCVNIPDMLKIIRCHNLNAIPVNILQDTLKPSLDQLKKALTPNTKAIILTHIYGANYNSDDIIAWAKENNLFIIEDLAQSWKGIKFNGHKRADFSMFSFGTIKTMTSFGGGISVLRGNSELARKMNKIHKEYTLMPNLFYFKRIINNIPGMIFLNNESFNKYMRIILMKFKIEYKEKMISLLRGFKTMDNFLHTFRRGIPDPMLAMIVQRFLTFSQEKYEEDIEKQKIGQEMLLKHGIKLVGYAVENRSFWLYPIIVPDIDLCLKMLISRGVDAYRGVTQLDIIESPVGSNYKYPQETLDYFLNLIYLPISKGVPKETIIKICKL